MLYPLLLSLVTTLSHAGDTTQPTNNVAQELPPWFDLGAEVDISGWKRLRPGSNAVFNQIRAVVYIAAPINATRGRISTVITPMNVVDFAELVARSGMPEQRYYCTDAGKKHATANWTFANANGGHKIFVEADANPDAFGIRNVSWVLLPADTPIPTPPTDCSQPAAQ